MRAHTRITHCLLDFSGDRIDNRGVARGGDHDHKDQNQHDHKRSQKDINRPVSILKTLQEGYVVGADTSSIHAPAIHDNSCEKMLL